MTVPVTLSGQCAVQYESSPGVWTTIEVHDIGSFSRTRRFAAPAGQTITAQKLRVVRIGGEDLAAAVATLRAIELRRETGELSPHRRWGFDFNTSTERYGLVVTEGNAEVYLGTERKASIPLPYAYDQVTQVCRAHSRDTLIAFLQQVPPHNVARQGAHEEWDARTQALTNIPVFDYDGQRTGGVDEVQQLQFVDFANGETFNISLEDETTGSIAYSINMATLSASIKSALEALENVGSGGVTVISTGANVIKVTFVSRNRAEDVGSMAPAVISSNQGLVRQATLTQGKGGGEAVISTTRGWPGVGVFFDERLMMARLASRPGVLLGSRKRQFFDFKTSGTTELRGIDVQIASDQSTPVLGLFAGPQLQAWTEAAEFYLPGPPLPNPPVFVASSEGRGMAPNTPQFAFGGGTAFIVAGGDAIAHFQFEEARQQYVAPLLSDAHSHLTKSLIDVGARSERSLDDPVLAAFVRADGDIACMVASPGQNVLSFTPWRTDGHFTAAGAELKGDLYLCVRREVEIGGELVERNFYERYCEGYVLDAAVKGEGPATEATGLWHLEGRTVALWLDGGDAGDVVVSGGVAVFPEACERTWEVGLVFVKRGVTLAIVQQEDPRSGASKTARAGEIAVNLGPTSSLKIGMHGKRLWPAKLKRRPEALLDQGPGEDAFTGWTRIFPVPGFQPEAQVEFVQDRPGLLDIRDLKVTVDS